MNDIQFRFLAPITASRKRERPAQQCRGLIDLTALQAQRPCAIPLDLRICGYDLFDVVAENLDKLAWFGGWKLAHTQHQLEMFAAKRDVLMDGRLDLLAG